MQSCAERAFLNMGLGPGGGGSSGGLSPKQQDTEPLYGTFGFEGPTSVCGQRNAQVASMTFLLLRSSRPFGTVGYW